MPNYRTIKKIQTGKRTTDGAGVSLVRVFGFHETKEFDPFLMLDAFDSTNPNDYTKGFPWHPHRGIETITYLISGNIEHGDSLGNKGVISDGDCQWMTAGSGIVHQEMPKASERMLGVQLWLNLPAKDKMTPPKYGDILSKNIPIVDEDGPEIRVISGIYKGITGAVQGNFIKPLYIDVKLNPCDEWALDTNKEDNLFIYIVEGEGIFHPESEDILTEKQALLFSSGDKIWVKARETGMRFLLLSAKPLHESIAWGGPIVMNTKQELDLAFKELDEGTFIK